MDADKVIWFDVSAESSVAKAWELVRVSTAEFGHELWVGDTAWILASAYVPGAGCMRSRALPATVIRDGDSQQCGGGRALF